MEDKKGHKAKKNETSFKEGNKVAEVWVEDLVRELFFEMRKNAETDEKILCLQDAIRSVNLYSSSLEYLLGKFPVFLNIKKDIQNAIVSRVNVKALSNEFNVAASIWRMKQLGEKDTQYQEVDNKSTDGTMTPKQTTVEFINARKDKDE